MRIARKRNDLPSKELEQSSTQEELYQLFLSQQTNVVWSGLNIQIHIKSSLYPNLILSQLLCKTSLSSSEIPRFSYRKQIQCYLTEWAALRVKQSYIEFIVFAGIIICQKMIHLDFDQEQENSLDILIKFNDVQQQPQPLTHQQCFLPITQISVTSQHPSSSLHTPTHPLPHQDLITQEIIQKMRVASFQQEAKLNQMLTRISPHQSPPTTPKKKRGEQIPSELKTTHSKRKIIKKMSRQ